MRINSKHDIAALGKHAQKQINKAIADVDKQRYASMKVGKTSPKKKKNKPSRIMTDPSTGLRYCPFPPTDPGAWLHSALNQKYGSFDEGGHHAHEVIIPGHERKFRWDHIIYGMVCIELDGYGYHFDLKSFKRDREKQKHALVNGFIVHRVTAQDIRNNLTGVLIDIEDMLSHHHRYEVKLANVGKTQYQLLERRLMECDRD